MIECSICHVMNEDSARFCAECGQRLVTPETSGQESESAHIHLESAPDITMAAAPSSQSFPSAASMPSPAPLNSSAPADVAPPPIIQQTPSQPQPRLRSPLLSGDEEADVAPERQGRLRPGRQQSDSPRGLRSPLLGGDEADDQYSDSFDTPPNKSAGLRSPLLGGSDFHDYPDEPPSGSHLHSPLLHPEETAYRASASGSGRPGHLRSPLLGQDYDQEDDFIEEQVKEDDVNVLRSPLLQSRVPIGDKPKAQAEPQANAATGQVSESEHKISADKQAILQKLEQSKYGQPTDKAGVGQSASQPLEPSTAPTNREPAQSPFRQPDPFASSAPPANNWPTITPSPTTAKEPDRSGSSNPWAVSASASDTEKKAEATSLPSNATTSGSASWVDIKLSNTAPLAGELASKPADTPLNANIQIGAAPSAPEPKVSAPEPIAAPSRPRLQSKLLAHDADDYDAPSPPPSINPSLRHMGESKSFPGPGPEHAGIIQFFVVCLCIGIAMKLWVIFEFFRGGALSPPVLGDELGQLVAMLFLVFLGSIYTKPPTS